MTTPYWKSNTGYNARSKKYIATYNPQSFMIAGQLDLPRNTQTEGYIDNGNIINVIPFSTRSVHHNSIYLYEQVNFTNYILGLIWERLNDTNYYSNYNQRPFGTTESSEKIKESVKKVSDGRR